MPGAGLLLALVFSWPYLTGAALVNLGAVSCTRELLNSGRSDYFLAELKKGKDRAAVCNEAQQKFQEAANLNSAAGATVWLGRIQLANGNFAEAASEFDRSLNSTPQNDVVRLFGGLAYAAINQPDTASALWSKMSSPVYALVRLGDKLADKEQCAVALTYYQQALRQNASGQDKAHLGLADCFYALKRLPEAAQEYEAVLKSGLKDAQAANKLGRLLVTLERPQEALPYLEQAVNLHEYPYYMIDLADAYGTLGNPEKAEFWYGETERIAPGSPAGPYARGNYYFKQHQYPNAIAAYEQVIALDPQGPAYYYTSLGQSYLANGAPDKAVTALTEALRRDPTNPVTKSSLDAAKIRLNTDK